MYMNKKILLIILLAVIVAGAAFFLFPKVKEDTPEPQVGFERFLTKEKEVVEEASMKEESVKEAEEETLEGSTEEVLEDSVGEKYIFDTYTMGEISKHNTPEDCWLLLNDNVYSVTGFDAKHPGGTAILQGCGEDATELYETRPMGSNSPHSQKARSLLEDFYIGNLE